MQSEQMRNVVGTWRITVPIQEDIPETFEALHTFFADGNWTEANSLGEANHGTWMSAGSTSFLTFEGYTFDEQRKHTGKFQVRASIKQASADKLTAQWEWDTIDLEGKLTGKRLSGIYEGTRMEVELP